jgi:predicted dehydrogenase
VGAAGSNSATGHWRDVTPLIRSEHGAPHRGADMSVNGNVHRLRRTRRRSASSDQTSPYAAYRRILRRKSSSTIGVGVVGYGYWGPNLVRNFSEQAPGKMVAVSDLSLERLGQVHARYPTVKLTTNYRDLIADPAIDAVVVATPVSSHFDIAMAALDAGKHVLVTKPITASREQAIQLIEAAEQRGLVLMVDHTFVYTGAVMVIKQLIDSGDLGQLYYYDSVRVNLGLFQRDVDVLWDLAVHDLSIMDHVLGRTPSAVAATGAAHVPGHQMNLAYLTCYFNGSLITHHHVNWLAPLKIRTEARAR